MTFPKPCDGCGRLRDLTFVTTGMERRTREIPFHVGEWLCEPCGRRRFPGYPWDERTEPSPKEIGIGGNVTVSDHAALRSFHETD